LCPCLGQLAFLPASASLRSRLRALARAQRALSAGGTFDQSGSAAASAAARPATRRVLGLACAAAPRPPTHALGTAPLPFFKFPGERLRAQFSRQRAQLFRRDACLQ